MGVRHHLPIKSDAWISMSSLFLKWRDIREQKNILEPFGFVSFRSTLGSQKQTKSSQQLLPTILNDCSLITTGNITHLSHKPMGIKQRGGRQWKKLFSPLNCLFKEVQYCQEKGLSLWHAVAKYCYLGGL